MCACQQRANGRRPWRQIAFYEATSLRPAEAPRLAGSSLATKFGFSLAAGDWDGDGASDLAAGAPLAHDGKNAPDAGAVYVYYAPAKTVSMRARGFLWRAREGSCDEAPLSAGRKGLLVMVRQTGNRNAIMTTVTTGSQMMEAENRPRGRVLGRLPRTHSPPARRCRRDQRSRSEGGPRGRASATPSPAWETSTGTASTVRAPLGPFVKEIKMKIAF